MAHSKSAKKRIKQNEKQRMLNKSEKTRMRNQTKKVVKLIQKSEDAEVVKKEFVLAVSLFDKAAKHGVIHTRQADRRKSRLQIKVNRFLAEKSS